MGLDHEKLDVYAARADLTRMIERGSQVREGEVVYGYVNDNGNEGQSGQPAGPGDSQ